MASEHGSLCIPSSPNWYCTKVIDSNENGIVAFGSRNCVVLYDLVSGGKWDVDWASWRPNYVSTLAVHKARIAGLCFSPFFGQMSLLASVGDDLNVNLTDVDTQEITVLHGEHKAKITCVAWARYNDIADYVVSGDENGVLVTCNVASKKAKCHSYHHKGAITAICSCPHSPHILAAGYSSGLILVLNLQEGGKQICTLQHHNAEIQSLCWAPFAGAERFAKEFLDDPEYIADSEKLLCSGSGDGTLKVWSTQRSIPIVSFTLPNFACASQKKQKDEKKGVWLAVAWPKCRPDSLLSGSNSGSLLSWDFERRGKHHWTVLSSKDNKQHSRVIFNIHCFRNVACTISMDRMIMFWNTESNSDNVTRLGMLPTLGGFVYSLSFSPVNSSIVALACGDNTIRTWNIASVANPYDVTSFWQGIKSKVTCLCWHPKKEGILAFGTHEGRVGIYNVLSNKQPTILSSFHVKTVYVVSWGPLCPTKDQAEPLAFHLYSYGNGVINVHDPGNPQKQAVNLNKLIKVAPSKKTNRSEIAWNIDFTLLCIGNNDGSVEIYSVSDLKLLLVLSNYRNTGRVYSIRWHPEYTLSSSEASKYRHRMAFVTQDSAEIQVYDLSRHLEGGMDSIGPIKVTSCDTTLVGHGHGIATLAWNPHLDAQLVTAAFDNSVRVWNVLAEEVVACFSNHLGRVLCAEWSPHDPDVIISGGEDYTVQVWKISEQDVRPSDRVLKLMDKCRKHTTRKEKYTKKSDEGASSSVTEDIPESESPKGPTNIDESVRQLLEQRKRELELLELGGDHVTEMTSDGHGTEAKDSKNANYESEKPKIKEGGNAVEPKLAGKAKKKKKRAEKSMFPLTSTLENRGKAAALDDCVALTDKLTAKATDATSGDCGMNLGLYAGRIDAYKLLKAEGDNHLSSDNLDYALHLEIWKGNIAGALKMAAKSEQLSDWLISMAAAVSPTFWSEMSLLYVQQLIGEGYPHKAVIYLLAQNKVHEAIEVLRKHVSYKDAIILAKVRLPPNDPTIARLMDEWATRLLEDGNSEAAAKCYLAGGQSEKAATILGQRRNPSSVRIGAYIAASFEDGENAFVYANRCIFECLVNADYSTAEQLLREHPTLKPYSIVIRVHQFLTKFLAPDGQTTENKVPMLENVRSWVAESCDVESDVKPSYETWLSCLSKCPALPTPHTESQLCAQNRYTPCNLVSVMCSHMLQSKKTSLIPGYKIVPWLSVIVTMAALRDGNVANDATCALRHLLTAAAVLHKSGDVERCRRFWELFSAPSSAETEKIFPGLAQNEENSRIRRAIMAYISLGEVHRMLNSERKWSPDREKGQEAESRDPSTEFHGLAIVLLDEESARYSFLKTRLTFVKVALASTLARQKRLEASGTESKEPEAVVDPAGMEPGLAHVPADRLVEHPGISADALGAECNRIEDEISRIDAGFGGTERSFPDPLESSMLLAELCSLHYVNCGCERAKISLRAAIEFGEKYAVLERQSQNFSKFHTILNAPER